MTDTEHLLIFSQPELSGELELSALAAVGYEMTQVSQLDELESWLNFGWRKLALIIATPQALEGLEIAAHILQTHPQLPIILVTREIELASLKQALEIGLIDYLTTPVEINAALRAIENAFNRQKATPDEQRVEQVLANITDGFILADLNSHLLLVNQSARDMFSLHDEKLEGRAVYEVFYHLDLLDIFKPHRVFPYRNEISMDDGRVYSAQASMIPGIGVAVLMQNITHLKELDRIKTDFVNTISHDLRSPLTSIYGFIGLLDRVGPVNRQQAEFIKHIQTSIQHITALINDLLDLNQVEAGYDLQMVEVHMKDILAQSVESLEYQISEKMLEVELSVDDPDPVMLGNPLHLQRMAANLIENAIKFTPPMGKIEIHCKTEASQLILEVSDNGPGIPLVDQPHIFDKFYRGSNMSQITAGTGLGLSIVKTIVDKHHGRIWLDSSPQGTTFSVILPC
jgi:two-component system phosphate regulon sensor histidine kinase PhoR